MKESLLTGKQQGLGNIRISSGVTRTENSGVTFRNIGWIAESIFYLKKFLSRYDGLVSYSGSGAVQDLARVLYIGGSRMFVHASENDMGSAAEK